MVDLAKYNANEWVRHSIRSDVEHDGVLYPGIVVPSSIEALKNFEVRDDDIWIQTYPKSGTHWVAEMVLLILNNGDPDAIDRTSTQGIIEMIFFEKDSFSEKKERHLPFLTVLNKLSSPRVILTHVHSRYLPKQIETKRPKLIYVGRNSKDVVTSLGQFIAGTEFSEFAKWKKIFHDFMDGTYHYGSWFDHVKTAWGERHEENRLFLKFEDMKKDPRDSVIRIANLMGRPLSADVLENVVMYSSFSGMKKTYENVEKKKNGIMLVKALGKHSYMRKGIIANWKSHFTVVDNEEFDEIYAKNMADTDLTFDFE